MRRLIDELGANAAFENRARLVLERLREEAGRVLARSSFKDAEIGRLELHLRNENGYAGYFSLNAEASETESLLNSAQIWAAVSRTRQTKGIDVALEMVHVPATGEARTLSPASNGLDLSQSARKLLSRPETHAFVLPMADGQDKVRGVIVVEFVAPRAMGTPFVFEDLDLELTWIVEVVKSYLIDAHSNGAQPDHLLPVIGKAMAGRVHTAARFARGGEIILLTGPSGAGKSKFARWIHERSPVAKGPFEVLELNAVPGDMQMGALTGWKKGAFTSSIGDHDGAIGRASGGTLFIDEIDKLSLETQAGLLRLLEEGKYRPLGSNEPERTADVRFIVGTNVDLHGAVLRGEFREDLYWRVNVLPVELPPLDERRDEIADWAHYMVANLGGPSMRIRWDQAALDFLKVQHWPGNLRQLNNVVKRAFALATLDDENDVTLRLEHVSVSFEKRPRRGLAVAFEEAARAFLEEMDQSEQVDVDLSLGFRSVVISLIANREGSLASAYERFGKGKLVENRNYRRAWAREREALLELARLDSGFMKFVDPDRL